MAASQPNRMELPCKHCGENFEIIPTAEQAVHPNCLPQKCGLCRGTHAKCKQCGAEFQKGANGASTKYCSEDCRHARKRDYHRSGRAEYIPKPPKHCEDCGAEVSKYGNMRYCSACREVRRLTGRMVNCDDCGLPFKTRLIREDRGHRCQSCHRAKSKAERASIVQRQLEDGTRQLRSGQTDTASQDTGALAERLFDVLCLRSNVACCQAIRETQPGWDRVIVIGQRAIRVQVKGRRYQGNVNTRSYANSSQPVSPDKCDLVAVIDPDCGEVVIGRPEEGRQSFHLTMDSVIVTNAMIGEAITDASVLALLAPQS